MADEATKLADVFSEDSLADIKKAWDETEPAPDYETTDGEPYIETDDNTRADDGPDDTLTISPAEADAAEKARLEHHTRIVEKNQQVAKAAARLELEKHRHKLAKEEYDGQVSELLDLIAEGPDYQQRLPLEFDEPRAATDDESQGGPVDNTDIGQLDVSDKIKQALRLADLNTINDLEIHAYNHNGKLVEIDGIGRAMRSQLEHALAEHKRGSKPYAGGELEV